MQYGRARYTAQRGDHTFIVFSSFLPIFSLTSVNSHLILEGIGFYFPPGNYYSPLFSLVQLVFKWHDEANGKLVAAGRFFT